MRVLLPVLALSFLPAITWAQTTADPSDPIKLGDVTVTGSLRSRLYVWDWFQAAKGENQYEYSGNLLRLNFSEKLSAWDWDAEFAVPFLLGLPSGATGPAPQGALGLGSNYFTANSGRSNTAMIFPKQLYVRFDALGGSEGQTLQIGPLHVSSTGAKLHRRTPRSLHVKRDRVSQRLLGDFGWSDVGRSFDGVHYSFSTPSNNFTFVGAVPTRGVFQVGWLGMEPGWFRVRFVYT